MINKLLTTKGFKNISVGIGVSIGEDLIVKAGQKGSGINDRIWIGDAVVRASKLSNIAGRQGKNTIGFSSIAYENFIEELEKRVPCSKSWFTYDYTQNAYFTYLTMREFEKWIDNNC